MQILANFTSNQSDRFITLRFFKNTKYILILYFNLFCCLFLRHHGDIEVNSGLSIFCRWNVNSLAAHDYKKVSLLDAYNAIHHYDLICASETYLDSSISNDKKDISVKGYSLVRADHLSNTKR